MTKPKPKSFCPSTPNKIGRKGEKNVQKSLGGVLTPGSRGGDLMVGKDILVEKKSTNKKSIVLKLDTLDKIDRIAFGSNRHPVLVVEFETEQHSFVNKEWAIVPLDLLKELLDLKNKL